MQTDGMLSQENQLAGIVLGTKQMFEIKGLSFDGSAF